MTSEALTTSKKIAHSPLTGASSELLFRHRVLGRHWAEYYFDKGAGYIFVKDPHWLEEAYSSAIAVTDTGCLARNQGMIGIVSRVLAASPALAGRGVDLGGGYGLFVRGMRDAGFDFHWSDRYAENLLARGFEADAGPYKVACAFEVLEHLESPLAFLREQRARYGFDVCFFSAVCFDPDKLPDASWWYWAFDTGQHLSFFSRQCLEYMAGELGMRLWQLHGEVYAFAAPDLVQPSRLARSKTWRALAHKVAREVPGLKSRRRKSLTFVDHLEMVRRLRSAAGEVDEKS